VKKYRCKRCQIATLLLSFRR